LPVESHSSDTVAGGKRVGLHSIEGEATLLPLEKNIGTISLLAGMMEGETQDISISYRGKGCIFHGKGRGGPKTPFIGESKGKKSHTAQPFSQ